MLHTWSRGWANCSLLLLWWDPVLKLESLSCVCGTQPSNCKPWPIWKKLNKLILIRKLYNAPPRPPSFVFIGATDDRRTDRERVRTSPLRTPPPQCWRRKTLFSVKIAHSAHSVCSWPSVGCIWWAPDSFVLVASVNLHHQAMRSSQPVESQ